MADDELLSDDDYVPVPLKEVARHELHPLGTAARIRELEADLAQCDAARDNYQQELSVLQSKLLVDPIKSDVYLRRIRELEAERDEWRSRAIKAGLPGSAPSDAGDSPGSTDDAAGESK